MRLVWKFRTTQKQKARLSFREPGFFLLLQIVFDQCTWGTTGAGPTGGN
jgi:hypothetical protein